MDALRPALGDVDVEVDDGLYGADAFDLLDRLRRVGASIGSVMVVAHNPGLHDLAIDLAADGEEAAMAQLHTKFPTAALATLDVGSAAWDQLGPGRAHLMSLVLPRELH